MSKRVFICVGHGGSDSGAVGYVTEKDATLVISLAAKAELERHGVVVGISRTRDEEDGLTREVNMANSFDADLVIAVHANAGGGDGFEAYVQTNRYASRSRSAAKEIECRVEELGQNSRGIKTKLGSYGDYYYWLRNVEAPTVLLEGFFVDNSEDVSDFDTITEQQKLGRAYAHGVLDYLNIPVSSSPHNSYTPTIRGIYQVTARGGLNLRSGPSTDSSIRETMPQGSTIICYGYYIGGWYYVKSQAGNTGYCSKDHLSKIKSIDNNKEESEMSKHFEDVRDNAWYEEAVEYCYEHGLMKGTERGKFEPDRPMTRAEVAQALTNLYKKIVG